MDATHQDNSTAEETQQRDQRSNAAAQTKNDASASGHDIEAGQTSEEGAAPGAVSTPTKTKTVLWAASALGIVAVCIACIWYWNSKERLTQMIEEKPFDHNTKLIFLRDILHWAEIFKGSDTNKNPDYPVIVRAERITDHVFSFDLRTTISSGPGQMLRYNIDSTEFSPGKWSDINVALGDVKTNF